MTNYYQNQTHISVSGIKAAIRKSEGKPPLESVANIANAFVFGRAVEQIIEDGSTVEELTPEQEGLVNLCASKYTPIVTNCKTVWQREYYVTRLGYKVRCKTDKEYITTSGKIIEDIKTTGANIKTNKKAIEVIYQFGYHMQAAAYLTITNSKVFSFIFLPKNPKAAAFRYTLTKESEVFKKGFEEWQKGLKFVSTQKNQKNNDSKNIPTGTRHRRNRERDTKRRQSPLQF